MPNTPCPQLPVPHSDKFSYFRLGEHFIIWNSESPPPPRIQIIHQPVNPSARGVSKLAMGGGGCLSTCCVDRNPTAVRDHHFFKPHI